MFLIYYCSSLDDDIGIDKSQLQNSNKYDNQVKYHLNSVVTTATGFAQDKKDAPASITFVAQEEIITRLINDLGDAIQDVPGVFVELQKQVKSNYHAWFGCGIYFDSN